MAIPPLGGDFSLSVSLTVSCLSCERMCPIAKISQKKKDNKRSDLYINHLFQDVLGAYLKKSLIIQVEYMVLFRAH